MRNIISYERARTTGVLRDDNTVHYTISIDGRKNSCHASFPWNGTLEATLAGRCCFLWDVPIFAEKGIVARIERDGVVAEVIPGKGWQLGRSAMDGAPVLVQDGTPFACDPRFETYWSS